MRKKRIYASFWVLYLACLMPAVGQTPTFAKSLFWEVSGKGKGKMYILGTHHLYPNEFVKKSEAIQKALQKSKVVVGEIVIENQMTMGLKMMKHMMMPDNSLKKLLSKEDYELLQTYFDKNMKMSLSAMNKMKPIAVYQMLIAQKYMEATGKTEQKAVATGNALDASIDGYVQAEGKRLEKQLRGLEDVEDQAKILFDGYSLERQAEMLMELVKNEKTGSTEEIKKMDEIYASQDIEALIEFTQKNMNAEETKMLLDDRNDKWIPQLEKMLSVKQTVFVAVGAGHLVGKSGVLTQLKAKGYTVKPILITM